MLKRFLLFIIMAGLSVSSVYGQGDDFCKAVNAIIHDAPDGFRNIKGKPSGGGNIWACGIKVPGTIASRFVNSMGLYYEGGFFQTKNKEEVKGAYEKYKATLKECFSSQGYTLTQVDNFYPGLGDYKKLIFMKDEHGTTQGAKPPAHITMEVIYSKEIGNYAIVMYIYEH